VVGDYAAGATVTDEDYRAEQRRIRAAIPFDLQDMYRDAPMVDDRTKQVAWLAKTIRAEALYHAVMRAFESARPPSEVTNLAFDIAIRLAWPLHVAESAVEKEISAATSRVLIMQARMEKAVRRLAYERAQASRLLAEAKAVSDESGLFVPSDLILSMVSRVARSTVGGGHSRRV
jgi:hypothetical protein